MEVLVIFAIVVILVVIGMYNSLVTLKNNVKKSASGIDVYLNQRFDLIPNLVECVKGYSKHEKEIFTEVTKLRNEYKSNGNDLEKAEVLNNKMNQLLAVAESYPDLKASEQYLNLQNALTKIESQLQAARRIYNADVTEYNNKLEVIPSNIIANICGFKPEKLFEIEEYKKENIKISL